jgi:predicted nucleic acid-binding protein
MGFSAPVWNRRAADRGNDLLIAAQALSLGFTLVTANDREFGKIDDLSCENWLV